MSDDIVARLREEHHKFRSVPQHNELRIDSRHLPQIAQLLSVSANEIERLRQLLGNSEQLREHVRALEIEIERYRLLEVTVMDLRRLLEVQDKQLEIAQRMILQLEERCTQGTKAPPESVSWLISSTPPACSQDAHSSSAETQGKRAT